MDAESSGDNAWVRVEILASFDEAEAFCRNPEHLFRLNPCLDFEYWQWLSPTAAKVRWFNDSNQIHFQAELVFEVLATGWVCHWQEGIKARTRLEILAEPCKTILMITDEYADIDEAQKRARLQEVDKSLSAWGKGVRDYFQSIARYGWIPGGRFYLSSIWLGLKPRTRRILFMLSWATVADLALFLLVWMLFWLES